MERVVERERREQEGVREREIESSDSTFNFNSFSCAPRLAVVKD